MRMFFLTGPFAALIVPAANRDQEQANVENPFQPLRLKRRKGALRTRG
jgi:hypothetical protein